MNTFSMTVSNRIFKYSLLIRSILGLLVGLVVSEGEIFKIPLYIEMPWWPYGEISLSFHEIPYALYFLVKIVSEFLPEILVKLSVLLVVVIIESMLLHTILDKIKETPKVTRRIFILNPLTFYVLYVSLNIQIISIYFLVLSYLDLKYSGKHYHWYYLFGLLLNIKLVLFLPIVLFYLVRQTFQKDSKFWLQLGFLLVIPLIRLSLFLNESYMENVLVPVIHDNMLSAKIVLSGTPFSVLLVFYVLLLTTVSYDKFYTTSNLFRDYYILLMIYVLVEWNDMTGFIMLLIFDLIRYLEDADRKTTKFWLGIRMLLIMLLIMDFESVLKIDWLYQIGFALLVGLILQALVVEIIKRYANRQSENLMLGLAGDSGSGKTTVLRVISDLFHGKPRALEGDGEHRWRRGDENWKHTSHLDPKANWIHFQSVIWRAIRFGRNVKRRDYLHTTGRFSDLKLLRPNRINIVCGLHTFFLKQQRDELDLKIYVNTQEELREHWKVKRDIQKRGYTREQVLAQIELRKPDALKYIVPQISFADIIIEYFVKDECKKIIHEEHVELALKITFSSNIDISKESISQLADVWQFSDDLDSQLIIFYSQPSLPANDLISHQYHEIQEFLGRGLNCSDGFEGVIQAITLLVLKQKRINEI